MPLKVLSNSPDMFIRTLDMRLTSTGIVCGLPNSRRTGLAFASCQCERRHTRAS